MAVQESSTRGGGGAVSNILLSAVLLATLGAIVMIALPFVNTKALEQVITLPTAAVAKPAPARPQAQPAAVPAPNVQQSIDNYNATATAQYPPAQNVDQLPADAPAPEKGERANLAAPAGDNVSVAEPVDDTHGTKQTAPINIQATHQCLHGQVWTDSGCHRPTPVK